MAADSAPVPWAKWTTQTNHLILFLMAITFFRNGQAYSTLSNLLQVVEEQSSRLPLSLRQMQRPFMVKRH